MADQWEDWEPSDKLPLDEFVNLVSEEYVTGAELFERNHPSWSVGDAEIVARAVLKPMTNKKTGQTRIFVDNREPSSTDRADIPVSIVRKPDGKVPRPPG
jgi:hypothetical protein